MRAFAAVFAREIAERSFVFPVGLGAGLLGLLASAVKGWSRPGAADVRLMAAAIGGALITLVIAIGLGASVFAGETAERRISFFFSRPIPAGALWAGKLAAVLVLAISPAALAVVPALLAGGGIGRSNLAPDVETAHALALFLVATVAVVLGAHAVATVVRLRSPWVGLDALFAGVFVVALLLVGRSLREMGVLPAADLFSSALFRGLVALVFVALLIASFVQVAAGRTDSRRAHGAFSATLWGVLVVALLALGPFTWLLASRSP